MKPSASPASSGETSPHVSPQDRGQAIDDLVTGIPFFGTWRRVYLLVFGTFILWVCLLAALSRIFS